MSRRRAYAREPSIASAAMPTTTPTMTATRMIAWPRWRFLLTSILGAVHRSGREHDPARAELTDHGRDENEVHADRDLQRRIVSGRVDRAAGPRGRRVLASGRVHRRGVCPR